jgi:Esterase/lipase
MNKKIGFLIIHGFAGNVDEIEPLNNYLLNKGFITQCTKLKGHTGKRADLAKVNYIDWISSAEESLLKLSSQCRKVIVIGFSMGGLIAVNLALKHNVDGLITLSTPIYHWDMKRVGLNILSDFKTRKFKNLNHYTKAAIRIPFTAMINFKILLAKTKPLFKQVRCPMFITQGLLDDTVHHRSADYIYSNIASEQKMIKYYNNSNHIICKSEDKDEVFNDISMFINENFLQNL